MTFTDRITVDAARATAEGRLYVDPAAEYLQDHFPGAPVLPGLVMLEAAVRVAAFLQPRAAEVEASVLDRVDRLQVIRPVLPGQTLEVVAERAPAENGAAVYTAQGRVAGELVMRARFLLRSVPQRVQRWSAQTEER